MFYNTLNSMIGNQLLYTTFFFTRGTTRRKSISSPVVNTVKYYLQNALTCQWTVTSDQYIDSIFGGIGTNGSNNDILSEIQVCMKAKNITRSYFCIIVILVCPLNLVNEKTMGFLSSRIVFQTSGN